MPFILNERFTIRSSKLILDNKLHFRIIKDGTSTIFVNIDHNYTPYIQQLIYGYIMMGSLNQDIVKEFMPSEDCAARTINEYLKNHEFVNNAKEGYFRYVEDRC